MPKYRLRENCAKPARRTIAAITAKTGRARRCWAIDDLIEQARQYETALVYQTVGKLEDSFDYEGMVAALKRHVAISDEIKQYVKEHVPGPVLHLSAGGCPVCERCAGVDGEPCRFPEKALASLEAYGIHVAKLAELCGLSYINGQNTVTYFGAFLFGKQAG